MTARRARRRPASRPSSHPAGRRGVAAATLLAMLVCQLPAPLALPTAANGKDRSELYPCRDRPCGCGSAAQCWAGCCCFTNAQKVAWAEANGVTLPAFVRAAAEREAVSQIPARSASSGPRAQRAEPKSEPTTAPAPHSCCGKAKPKKPEPKPSCCGTDPAACEIEAAKDEDAATGDAPAKPLCGWHAQKCRGEIAACGSLPWALRPNLYEALGVPPVAWDRPRSYEAEACGAEPPTPPPRATPAAFLS